MLRTLINFFVKHSYIILFIIIEIICFSLIFSNNIYQRNAFFYSSNKITASLQEIVSNISAYTKLRTINDSLIAENERLKNKLEIYRNSVIPSIEHSGYEYVSANVVANNINKTKNYLTINKGSKHGIKPEMGVIGTNGIVGIVKFVSSGYSTVLPIINPDAAVSVKIKKNNYFGSMQWNSQNINEAYISGIPGYVDVQLNDEIVTSSYSVMFPEGIPVGTVVKLDKESSTNFYKIIVKLNTDFYNLHYVYVISNKNQQEQLEHVKIQNE